MATKNKQQPARLTTPSPGGRELRLSWNQKPIEPLLRAHDWNFAGILAGAAGCINGRLCAALSYAACA